MYSNYEYILNIVNTFFLAGWLTIVKSWIYYGYDLHCINSLSFIYNNLLMLFKDNYDYKLN